jgi:hypothetical protein
MEHCMSPTEPNSTTEIPKVKLTDVRCGCATCGQVFNSVGMFDKHRIGKYMPLSRRCLSPVEMRAKGWSRNEGGFWIRKARRELPPGMAAEVCTRRVGAEISPDPVSMAA